MWHIYVIIQWYDDIYGHYLQVQSRRKRRAEPGVLQAPDDARPLHHAAHYAAHQAEAQAEPVSQPAEIIIVPQPEKWQVPQIWTQNH